MDAVLPGTRSGTCDGIDVVISALGAPVSPSSTAPRSYLENDLAGNLALLRRAPGATAPERR